MTEIQFFYRINNLQIDAVYKGNKTNSTVFKDSTIYVEVNVTDPPYEVTRDHKVVLATDGTVMTTTPAVNPVQPVITVELPLCEHAAVITDIDPTRVRPLYATITYEGQDFPQQCFVSQDLVDAYLAGNLVVGDYVIVQFLENVPDKPFASQKVFKTW